MPSLELLGHLQQLIAAPHRDDRAIFTAPSSFPPVPSSFPPVPSIARRGFALVHLWPKEDTRPRYRGYPIHAIQLGEEGSVGIIAVQEAQGWVMSIDPATPYGDLDAVIAAWEGRARRQTSVS